MLISKQSATLHEVAAHCPPCPARGKLQVEFPAGKSIFHKGDVGDEFYLVRSGSVVVVDSQDKVCPRRHSFLLLPIDRVAPYQPMKLNVEHCWLQAGASQ